MQNKKLRIYTACFMVVYHACKPTFRIPWHVYCILYLFFIYASAYIASFFHSRDRDSEKMWTQSDIVHRNRECVIKNARQLVAK